MSKNLDYKDCLTNEFLNKRFKNQFDLVRYAIQLAENMVRSGRASTVTMDSQNTACLLLAEIAAGKDRFEEIHEDSTEFVASHQDVLAKRAELLGGPARLGKENKKDFKKGSSKQKGSKNNDF